MKKTTISNSLIILAVCLLFFSYSTVHAVDGMGAIVFDGGTAFRVWAPNATSVGVKGSFNGWSTTALTAEGNGNWYGEISNAKDGDEYKYVINYNNFTFDRRDARSFRVNWSGGNSIIYDHSKFDWGGDDFNMHWFNDLVIYQMHPGTFYAPDGSPPGTFYDAVNKLDHLQRMGFSAIQLMPSSEFGGDFSMGYNPADSYAIESAYGSGDGLKTFVREAHKRGLAVMMDVVHNHYGPQDNTLWQYDGWQGPKSGGIYFYSDDRVSTPWGESRPDYGRSEVRDYIRDYFRMLFNDYHLDGYRWDSVYFTCRSPFIQDGFDLLKSINQMTRNDFSGKISIAEDDSSGLEFDSEWDAAEGKSEFGSAIEYELSLSSDTERNVWNVINKMDVGSGHGRVIYTESHDMVNEENGKVRLPRHIDSNDPESVFAKKRTLLGAVFTMTAVGIPQVFQGQELFENWGFRPQNAQRWDRATTYSGFVQAYTDLIKLRRNFWGDTQGLKGTGMNKTLHVNNDDKVFAYHRWDQGGVGDDVVVVVNMKYQEFSNYSIDMPYDGTWYVVFNSDSKRYDSGFGDVGGTQVTASGKKASVNLGKYGALILTRSYHAPSEGGLATVTPNSPSDCEDVEIRYTPNDSALKDADPVYIQIGRNGWSDVIEPHPTMTKDGDDWVYTYSSTGGTRTIHFAFHDTGTNNWDNNGGNDWSVIMNNCNAPTAGSVTFDPAAPEGCEAVKITYDPSSGVLKDATKVYLHLGADDWSKMLTPGPTMTSNAGKWEYTYTPAEEIYNINFAFHDGNTNATEQIWDNNDGQDWKLDFDSCHKPITIVIESPLDDTVITATNVQVSGTSSETNGPDFIFINSSIGQVGTHSASANWSSTNTSWPGSNGVPLAVGTNYIVAAIPYEEFQDGSSDSSRDSVYDSGWEAAQNGGEGFQSWLLSGGDNSGFFIAGTNEANLSISNKAWGLWANSDETATATRSLQKFLAIGSSIALDFDNNFIETGKSVGIALLNRDSETLFEFFFSGGGDNYYIKDSTNSFDTGIGWVDSGLSLKFTLDSPSDYTLEVSSSRGDTNWTRSMVSNPDQRIAKFKIWNYSSGNGWEYNLYVDNLTVTGPQWSAYDSVTIYRNDDDPDSDNDNIPDSWEEELVNADPDDDIDTIEKLLPGDDFDGDGVSNIDEYIAGTDANDDTSYLYIDVIEMTNGVRRLEFPSVTGRKYTIWASESLLSDSVNWKDVSTATTIWGTDKMYPWDDNNDTPVKRFYHIRVEKP